MFGEVSDLKFIPAHIKAILNTYIKIKLSTEEDNEIMDVKNFRFDPTGVEYEDVHYNNFTVAMGVALIAYAITKVDVKLLEFLQQKIAGQQNFQLTQKYLRGLQLSLAYLEKKTELEEFTNDFLNSSPSELNLSGIYEQVIASGLNKVLSWLVTVDDQKVKGQEYMSKPSIQSILKQLHLKVKVFKEAEELEDRQDYDILIWHDESDDYQYPFVIMFPEELESLKSKFSIQNQLLTKKYQLSLLQQGNQNSTYGYLFNCLRETYPGYDKFQQLLTQYDSPLEKKQFLEELETQGLIAQLKQFKRYEPQVKQIPQTNVKQIQESKPFQSGSIMESQAFDPFADEEEEPSYQQQQQQQQYMKIEEIEKPKPQPPAQQTQSYDPRKNNAPVKRFTVVSKKP